MSRLLYSTACLGNTFRNHPYITSAKDWVGGSRKLQVLLTFSTVFMLIADIIPISKWMDGSEKAHNYADVIYGWSLTVFIRVLRDSFPLCFMSKP